MATVCYQKRPAGFAAANLNCVGFPCFVRSPCRFVVLDLIMKSGKRSAAPQVTLHCQLKLVYEAGFKLLVR